jgi:ABC-type Fe3+/spermidine/putrescine transport system ATPase subunit
MAEILKIEGTCMSGLKIRNLSVRYGSGSHAFQALKGINLDITEGTFVTLLGPSGSGKTTLLRCVAGLVTPAEGRIEAGSSLFYDAGTRTGLHTRQRNLGMVFQAFALWPHMTIADNIAFPLRMRGVPPEKQRVRADELLKLVGLAGLGQRYPTQLSGGQQQRVGLARAISGEPTLLLMDEPLSSLDARLREEMRSYIRRLQRELGITVLYVTHDREEALGLSDDVVILSGGTIVSNGSPRHLYSNPPDSFTAAFLAGWNIIGDVRELEGTMASSWLRKVSSGSSGGKLGLPVDLDGLGIHGAAETQVQGEIINVEFLGANVRLELLLPGISRPVFVMQSGQTGEACLRLEQRANIGIPIEAFRVLPDVQ